MEGKSGIANGRSWRALPQPEQYEEGCSRRGNQELKNEKETMANNNMIACRKKVSYRYAGWSFWRVRM